MALHRKLVATAALSLLALAACGSDEPTPPAAAPTTQPAPTTTTAEAPAPATEAPATTATTAEATAPTAAAEPAADVVISVVIVDGRIEAERRYEASLGDTVELRAISDIAEELHLHGYDQLLRLEAGVEASLTFEADLPGVWEAELHFSDREVFQLQVS